MVATISPAISHQEETLNTLKYAKRAKAIRNSSDRARITRLQGREAPSESAAVAGLKAKLHQLQCQISRQVNTLVIIIVLRVAANELLPASRRFLPTPH